MIVGNPGSPTTPPENLLISKNINLILLLLTYLKFLLINPVSITNFGVSVDISDRNNKFKISSIFRMLSIGILTYNAPKTLENTLNSYKQTGLLDLSDDVFVVSQMSDKQSEEKTTCDSFGVRCVLLPDNGRMAWGFKTIYENAKYENILFLENDFVINANKKDVRTFYANCLYFLGVQKADIVRARSRKDPGFPNYAHINLSHIDPSEFINDKHLSECMYWVKDPEVVYPSKISRIKPFVQNGFWKWYKTTSYSCNYTNNPYACTKTFFRNNILPYVIFDKNLEDEMNNEWRHKNFTCVFGAGLFTHDRKFDGY
jgi:glycosyltransferase involved in cell wall biosynthesis